ncbi:hypothetical protein PHMEG_0002521 [Phytophthora megakarya]|uniref:Serine/threonine protein kinase n=1 Tax=Phytophthora megakarya TaxID=4795 RepID=A0A225WYI4_9STRA|nr:hypothetical protein PHMEG_0002521 [Phytophthora megakarya]
MIPLAQACSFRSTRLLDRIWQNSDPKAVNGTGWSLCRHLRADIHYYRFQFTKSLRAAVESGDLKIVNWVLEHFSGCVAEQDVVEEAASCGRLDILKHFLEYSHCADEERNVILWGGNDMILAIQGGHGDLARWLYENTPDAPRNLHGVMEFAVRQYDRAVIQWHLDTEKSDLLLPPPMINATGSNLEVLQWIVERDFVECSDYTLEGAAKNGRLDIVKWLVEKGITKGTREAVQAACSAGHLDVVKWLLVHSEVCYPHFAISFAIRQGHLDIIKHLCEVGAGYEPSRMMVDSASFGHLHVVKWILKKYGLGLLSLSEVSQFEQSRPNAMDRAASNGYLHILKFLHSVAMDMQREGEGGDHTCSDSALLLAAAMGHFEVLKWLCRTYPQLNFPPTTTCMVAQYGNLHILQWLHHQCDVQWSSNVMDSAAENGHIAVVKWLHENRNEGCTTSAMTYAARNGHLQIVRWLHCNRMESCTLDAMDFATYREHFEILLFLRANITETGRTVSNFYTRGHKQQHIISWLTQEHLLETESFI